ncbi:MAG: electron transfer flavoprotein subunit alpha [Elusimicrobia bacterium]|nr:electron transfer flavoprotein subunit alpha [Elusimicrobiota bacterium]
MPIKVDSSKCTGCGLCEKSCPFGAISIEDRAKANKPHPKFKKIAVISSACTLCGACVDVCPFGAISVTAEKKETDDIALYKGVWVIAETEGDEIHSVTFELLAKGRELADKRKTYLGCVLIGFGIRQKAEEIISSGADKVFVCDNKALEVFVDNAYVEGICGIIKKEKPEIVLLGATAIGRAIASRISGRLKTGLTADCTGLDIDHQGLLVQTRPAFGGNIMAEILTAYNRPQMATVRHKVFKPLSKDLSKRGEVIEFGLPENLKLQTKVKKFVEDVTQKVNIADADIIVSGGRGVGGPDGFKVIEEFASALGGAVGASRAAVDSGWIPYSHQVGQTGRTVCPKLYVACGISGAIQHLVGMQSSDVIVAINKDPSAAIFKVATFGIVADLFEAIPAIIGEIKKIRS